MKKGNDRKIGMRYNGDMDSLEVDFVLETVNKLIRNHGIELTRRY